MARGRVRRFECRNLPGHSHVRHGGSYRPHGTGFTATLITCACVTRHVRPFNMNHHLSCIRKYGLPQPDRGSASGAGRDALPPFRPRPAAAGRAPGPPWSPPFDTPAKRERRVARTRVWTSDMCTRSSLRVSLTGVRRVGVSVCAPRRAVEPRRFAHNLLAPLLHAGQFGLTYLSSGAPPQARGALLAYGGKELRWERAPELCG